MEIIERARLFATAAHGAVDQRRKYTDEPYINHPAQVVTILRTMTHNSPTPEMFAAAWLHDVVEDTEVTHTTILEEFGPTVSNLVRGLTDVSTLLDGNRVERKEIDRQHTAKQSPECHTVKLADLISNSSSILLHDPEFARVYLREKQLLLEVLRDGDPALWEHADSIVRSSLRAFA